MTTIEIDVPIGTGTRHGTIGSSPTRPDGIAKVQGAYAFSSDLSADGCLWGSTLRSPHPSARIVSIDLSAAWKISGVEAIITADDVPGSMFYGLITPGPAGVRLRRRALRRRADRRGRR